MNPENLLVGTASLFLALGDKTRLRLLNLMRDREICVSSFTGTLGHSQPLISRHLAYLRNSGIVEARRDGKWMHYSIATNLDANTGRLLAELFKWMETQEGLRIDREQYVEAYPNAVAFPPPAREPKPENRKSTRRRPTAKKAPRLEQPEYQEPDLELGDLDLDDEVLYTAEDDVAYNSASHHNELEDFLL
jgi:ArsR family transcriptional regulator